MSNRVSTRVRLTRTLFEHRRGRMAGVAVRRAFAHASRLLPIRRVVESDQVVVFHHPVPSFVPIHLLMIPKRAIASLSQLDASTRDDLVQEIERLVPAALEQCGVEPSRFVVVVNGGRRQDVRQLHFHLVTDIRGLDDIGAVALPEETWIDVAAPAGAIHQVRSGRKSLLAGMERAAEMMSALSLDERGYTLLWDARSAPLAHLTAGPH